MKRKSKEWLKKITEDLTRKFREVYWEKLKKTTTGIPGKVNKWLKKTTENLLRESREVDWKRKGPRKDLARKFREVNWKRWKKVTYQMFLIASLFLVSWAISSGMVGNMDGWLQQSRTGLWWLGGILLATLALFVIFVIVGYVQRRRKKKPHKKDTAEAGEGWRIKRFLLETQRPSAGLAVLAILLLAGTLVVVLLATGIIGDGPTRAYHGRYDVGEWVGGEQSPLYPNTKSWGYRGKAEVRGNTLTLRVEKDFRDIVGLDGIANGVIIAKAFELGKTSRVKWHESWKGHNEGRGKVKCTMYSTTFDCDFILEWKGPDGLAKARRATFSGR